MALFTTFITTPIVISIYKPAKLAVTKYKHRTIERKDVSKQVRILSCFYSSRSIPTLINLIEVSRGTAKKEGLRVYAMHLTELSERSSAILMVHKAKRNGLPFWNKAEASDTNEVVVAFETFEQLSKVSIKPTTAISPMNTMHEDIVTSAESKRVAMIILPFHKHQRLDGHFETTRSDLRNVNRKVLQQAPCSVGILVDRGLGGASHVPASNVDFTITILFFGGHDDREALAYGLRMAEHPGITLVVARFVIDPAVAGSSVKLDMNQNSSPEVQHEDEAVISSLKEKISNDGSIKYEEKTVKDAKELIEGTKPYSKCNLFLVGRMPEGQVVASLNKNSECPELGPIGNLLISSEYPTTASLLVVQQYRSQLPQCALDSLEEGETSDGNESS